jgi:hypothetical protein
MAKNILLLPFAKLFFMSCSFTETEELANNQESITEVDTIQIEVEEAVRLIDI